MIATAEVRRNAILHEVDRHRTTWGRELRRAAQQAEEAGFKLIEAQSDKTKTAAEQGGQDKRQSRERARKHRPDNRSGQSPLGEKCAPPRAARSCRPRFVAGS